MATRPMAFSMQIPAFLVLFLLPFYVCPAPQFTGTPNIQPLPIVTGETLSLTVSSASTLGGQASVDLGNGQTAMCSAHMNEIACTYTYTTTGTFTLEFYAKNGGQTATTTTSIYVNPSPFIANVPVVSPLNPSTWLTLTTFYVADQTALTSASVSWGDASSSTCTIDTTNLPTTTITCPSHSYATTGTKTLEFIVKQGGAASSTTTTTAQVVAPPSFFTSPTVLTSTHQTEEWQTLSTFTVVDYGPQLTVSVNFGDTTTATCTTNGAGPTYTVNCPSNSYFLSQTYTLTFYAEDVGSQTTTTSDAIVYGPPQFVPPIVLPSPLGTGSWFTVSTFTVNDGTVIPTASVNWGDSSSSTCTVSEPHVPTATIVCPSHSYASSNTVTLTFYIDDQSSNTQTTTVSVQPVAPPSFVAPPTISGTQNPLTWQTLSTFTVTDYGPQLTVTVNYGDGSSTTTCTVAGSGPTYSVTCPSHSYLLSQTYTLAFLAVDIGSASTTTSDHVIPGAPNFNAISVPHPIYPDIYFTLTAFTVTDYGVAPTVSVDFGDGTGTSTCTAVLSGIPKYTVTCPSHSYTTLTPTFTLNFLVTDFGTSTISVTATTSPPPPPTITVSAPAGIYATQSATLPNVKVDDSLYQVTTVTVDYGDPYTPASDIATCTQQAHSGQTYTFSCPSHVYTITGQYTVTFYAADAWETTTSQQQQQVNTPPAPNVQGGSSNSISSANTTFTISPFTVQDVLTVLTVTVNYGDIFNPTFTATCTIGTESGPNGAGKLSFPITCPSYTYTQSGNVKLQFDFIDAYAAEPSTAAVVILPPPSFSTNPVVPTTVLVNSNLVLPNFNVYDPQTLVTATVDFGDSSSTTCAIYGTRPSFYVACPQTHQYTMTGVYYLTFFISDASQNSIYARSTDVIPPSPPEFITNPSPLTPINVNDYELIPQFVVGDTYAPITTATVAYGDNHIDTCTISSTADQYTWNVYCPQTHLYPAAATYTLTFFIEDNKGQTATYTTQTLINTSSVGVSTTIPAFVIAAEFPSIKCFTPVATETAYVRYYTLLKYQSTNILDEYIQPTQFCLVLSTTRVCCPPPPVMAKTNSAGQLITYGVTYSFCGAAYTGCDSVSTTYTYV